MKTLFALGFGTVPLLATGVALAQAGNMMNGSEWHDGIWGPIMLLVVIAGVVVLLMQRKGK